LKLLQKLFGIMLFFIIFCRFGMAQDYLWPTDASHYLTSSFAEYRPGHFHAGIDIKTWGRIGYKVFAIRDGYIMRINVSPYGYGKALYQKLDTGEIVVYAHLDRFNIELQNFVKTEQRRKGAYRINNYFGPAQFPVKKGELIGYTGGSGIGSPHLHFETRDPNNNPVNPFLLGYKVEDTIPPTVDAINITPLDFNSRVNSDVIPLIEKPIRMNDGSYQLANKPLVSGNIGFAIDCFDRANGVNNSFAVYKRDFYVDGGLYFSATYDKFSYGVSNLIDLDRDFRLMSRGMGRFQKLYKERLNKLPFYRPAVDEAGVISCDPNSESNALMQNRIGRGEHQFVIQLYDFFGNNATVIGSFLVGEKKTIYADYQLTEPDQLYISNIRDQYGIKVEDPEIFVSLNQGISWRKMALNLVGSDSLPIVKYLLSPMQSQTIVKIQTVQDLGIGSFPSYYLVHSDSSIDNMTTDLSLEKDFYDDYIRLNLTVNGLIRSNPKLLVQQIGLPATEVSLWQNRFNEFIGVYRLVPGKDGPLSIEADVIDPLGRELTYWEQFEVRTVFPNRGGSITSKDGLCRAVFNSSSVYKNLFLRIENQGPSNDSNYDFVGEIYEIAPQDVPLKRSATIGIKYPATDQLPDKLGIYQVDRSKPGFSGNDIDFQKNTISGNISNLGSFTLIRDTIPPYIEIRHPGNNAQLTDKKPTLLAAVYDELSGIANELSIVMKLDDRKVIAEFDPDARTIKFEPDDPLSPGQHTISVWAIDNSKNEASVSQKFYILE
jgi:hypothetical protein